MKIMMIFGTRPEGIKMAPLVNECKKDATFDCVVVNTAQHREMLDSVLELFDITPDYDFDLMKEGQTPESLSAEMIHHLSETMEAEQPDLVLVHGDTTTTFLGTYVAFLKQIPVGHVEAGLRTYNRYSPFPEEMNRQLVGRLATIHFAPTDKNKKTLIDEKVDERYISVVGNTVIDALLDVSSRPISLEPSLDSFLRQEKKTILLTTHRRENLGQLEGVYNAINRLLESFPDVQVVFPVHKNPKVREQVHQYLKKNDRVLLTEPLDYESFAQVMKQAHFIITDSGGIQEEAPALGKPVLVVRQNTERQEGVEAGTLLLVGTLEDDIYEESVKLLTEHAYYESIAQAKNPYGDGTSAQKILSFIKRFFL